MHDSPNLSYAVYLAVISMKVVSVQIEKKAEPYIGYNLNRKPLRYISNVMHIKVKDTILHSEDSKQLACYLNLAYFSNRHSKALIRHFLTK